MNQLIPSSPDEDNFIEHWPLIHMQSSFQDTFTQGGTQLLYYTADTLTTRISLLKRDSFLVGGGYSKDLLFPTLSMDSPPQTKAILTSVPSLSEPLVEVLNTIFDGQPLIYLFSSEEYHVNPIPWLLQWLQLDIFWFLYK